jgi:5'-3' exonuclease
LGVDVHLVDGTYELFRCFHGAPRAVGPTGREVGAARGMLATLRALVADPAVTHVAVTFDSLVATPGDPISTQAPLGGDVCRALGLVLWPAGRFKGDEILASAARWCAERPEVDRVVICTTDLDLLQCVRGKRVVLLDRSRQRYTDEVAVRTRFGVAPAQLPALFALVGDRSDGVPGLPGWGLRTAAAVLARYGTIDHIADDACMWDVPVRGAERLAAVLRRRRDETRHACAVLTLRDDVPLVIRDVSELAVRGEQVDLVEGLLAELGAG